MPRKVQSETAAQTALRELNGEIALREEKLRENTDEIFTLQQALQRRFEAAKRLEVELDQFEAVREEARRAVRAEQADWIKKIKQNPPPIRIASFEECEKTEAAA